MRQIETKMKAVNQFEFNTDSVTCVTLLLPKHVWETN